jgi:hypothetical protein
LAIEKNIAEINIFLYFCDSLIFKKHFMKKSFLLFISVLFTAYSVAQETQVNSSSERNLPRFTISANIGPAWRTDGIPDAIYDGERDFYKDLTSGYQMNIAGDYFFSDNYGIRLAYQRFSSTADLSPNGQTLLTGEIAMNVVYPAFVARFATKNQKWLFDGSVGVGYIDDWETGNSGVLNQTFEANGSAICGQFTLGAQYFITKELGIGINFTYTGGSLSADNTDFEGVPITIDDNEKTSLNHIGLLFGLRYHIR